MVRASAYVSLPLPPPPIARCIPFMRPFLPLVLAVCLITACGPDAPSPAPTTGMALPADYAFPDADTIRVATWNLEHFVDGHDNPYIDAGTENTPAPDLKNRKRRVARALRRLDADLLVLQEAESEAFLQSFVEDRLGDTGYRFATSVESPTWYMNVVLLSRYPLGVVRNYADVVTPIVGQEADNGEPAAQSLTNHRLWTADVRVAPNRVWTLIGAHLKAGRSAADRGWRIGQIRFLHAELSRLRDDRPAAKMLVAGDLNSLPDSPELRLLLNNPDRPAPDSVQPLSLIRFSEPRRLGMISYAVLWLKTKLVHPCAIPATPPLQRPTSPVHHRRWVASAALSTQSS